MGDRICIMKDGEVMQVADPLTLYNHPDNRFVAGFIGSPPMNFVSGLIRTDENRVWFEEDNNLPTRFRVALDQSLARLAAPCDRRVLLLGVRPEDVRDLLTVSNPNPNQVVRTRVEITEPLGHQSYVYLSTGAQSFVARMAPTVKFAANQETNVYIRLDRAHLFDPGTGAALR